MPARSRIAADFLTLSDLDVAHSYTYLSIAGSKNLRSRSSISITRVRTEMHASGVRARHTGVSVPREMIKAAANEEKQVAKGVSINKRAIAKFQNDIQREFDKKPIKVPINADPATASGAPQPSAVNHYHGPVVTVNGGQAQVAWGDGTITQGQDDISQVTVGYEDVAHIVADILANLDSLSLSKEDNQDARENAETLLAEVVKAEPDKGVVRRGATMLKGLLTSVTTGVNQAVTAESAEYARDAIEALGMAIGS